MEVIAILYVNLLQILLILICGEFANIIDKHNTLFIKVLFCFQT